MPDGRGELAYKYRLPHNQRTYPNHHRPNKPHQIRGAIQFRKRAPPHRALTGPPPTQRGRLAFINRLPTTSPPIPATAKQEPEMSRPPWGKGNRVSGGRGELALNPRLPHNQRTYLNHHRATNPHQARKAIQSSKRALPKGGGSYNSNTFYIKQHLSKNPNAVPCLQMTFNFFKSHRIAIFAYIDSHTVVIYTMGESICVTA